MNPKPLLALNHFTVPCSFTVVPLLWLSYLVRSSKSVELPAATKKGRELCKLAAPLMHYPKVLQEQQTQQKTNTGLRVKLGKRWLGRVPRSAGNAHGAPCRAPPV